MKCIVLISLLKGTFINNVPLTFLPMSILLHLFFFFLTTCTFYFFLDLSRWVQTISDVTVYVTIPPALVGARYGDIKVEVDTDTISMEVLECQLFSVSLSNDLLFFVSF